MISSRKQSRSFATLQINACRHDYLPGISVLMHAMKELNVARDDIQAIGKRSPLVTPLGGKVFWVRLRRSLATASEIGLLYIVRVIGSTSRHMAM